MADAWDCHWGGGEEREMCLCGFMKNTVVLTSHGTSYGKEKEHASALRLNDQRT